MAPGPGRPFVLVSPGGRFTATDATLSDLGTAPRDGREQADVEDHPGLDFHTGSTGSLVRTSLLRNGTGLQLDGSQGVHLEGVTVSGSAGTGLVLRGDRGTTMSGVRAEHNGAYGVQVTAPSTDRPITGIATTGNGSFGIGLDKQTGTHVTAVSTSGDGSGGVELTRSRDVTVSALTAADEPAGVFTHVNNANVVLDQLTDHRRAARRGGREDHGRPDHAGVDDPGRLRRRDRRRRQGRRAARRGRARLPDGAAGRAGRGRRHRRAVSRSPAGRTAWSRRPERRGWSCRTCGRTASDGHAVSGRRARTPGSSAGAITGGATGIDVAAATSISGTSIRPGRPGHPRGVHRPRPRRRRRRGRRVRRDRHRRGSPFLLTRSQVHALEAVRGTLDRGGDERPLPAAAEPARRHRDPAGPAGGVACR